MAPAGGDAGAGEGGRRPIPRGGDPRTGAAASAGQDLGAESGSRKRKAAVLSGDSGSLIGSGEHLTVACDDSQRTLKEIEDLRARLDEDVKELGYCEANQKLRAELAVKVKEIHRLRKQNEEMQAKYDVMRKPNEELYDNNDGPTKQNEELQANNGGLVKQNEVLQTSNDGMKMVNGEPHAKNDGLTIQNEELKANNDSLTQQNEELQSKNDGLAIHNEQLQAKNVSLAKQNAELQTISDVMRKGNRRLHAENASLLNWSAGLQAKIDGLRKQNEELQAKNGGLRKQTKMLHAKNMGLMVQIGEMQFKNDSQRKWSEELQAKNGSLTKGNKELQAKNDSLTKRIEKPQAKNDGLTKRNEELQAKINDSMMKWNKELQGLYMNITKLENEIDTKRKHLRQLEELHRTFFPIPQPEEVKRMLHKSSVEVQSTSQGLKDGLTGCTDIGTKNSGDIILESVPHLKQAEAILCQAASNFEEIGHLQTQVTKSETAVDQLIMDSKLAETKAALKKEIVAYAAYLECAKKKNEEAESKKASSKQQIAMMQQVHDASVVRFDDTEVDTRICDLITRRKSKSSPKKNKEHRNDTKTNEKVS